MTRTHSFAVQENVPLGTSIGRISVFDPDATASQRFTFLIVNEECARVIRVSDDGELQVFDYLDRETTSHYDCVVEVNDGQFVEELR